MKAYYFTVSSPQPKSYFHSSKSCPLRKVIPSFAKLSSSRQENEEGKKRKEIRLKEEDPVDWERREKQKACLTSYTADKETQACHQLLARAGRALLAKLWPPRLSTGFMLLSGLASGFLGGIIGVRGPPLIIFFFFFEYPKAQVKANGAVIAAVNTVIRIVTYTFKSPPGKYCPAI